MIFFQWLFRHQNVYFEKLRKYGNSLNFIYHYLRIGSQSSIRRQQVKYFWLKWLLNNGSVKGIHACQGLTIFSFSPYKHTNINLTSQNILDGSAISFSAAVIIVSSKPFGLAHWTDIEISFSIREQIIILHVIDLAYSTGFAFFRKTNGL